MTRQLENKFSGKIQGKIHHVVVAKEKNNAIVEEKILTTEKVTTSEEVDKGTKHLDDMKEAVVTKPFLTKTLLTTEKVTTSE